MKRTNNARILYLVLLSIFVVCLIVKAQEITDRFEFEHYSIEEGLNQSTVYNVIQDSRGFLWLSTGEGISRYDGYSFLNYIHDDDDPESISHHAVLCSVEDGDGNLLIATRLGGLNKFDRKKEKFQRFMHDPENPNSLSNNSVWSIYLEDNQFLWIATRGSGIDVFNIETGEFRNYRHSQKQNSINHDVVWNIVADNSGNIWAEITPGTGSTFYYSL